MEIHFSISEDNYHERERERPGTRLQRKWFFFNLKILVYSRCSDFLLVFSNVKKKLKEFKKSSAPDFDRTQIWWFIFMENRL